MSEKDMPRTPCSECPLRYYCKMFLNTQGVINRVGSDQELRFMAGFFSDVIKVSDRVNACISLNTNRCGIVESMNLILINS